MLFKFAMKRTKKTSNLKLIYEFSGRFERHGVIDHYKKIQTFSTLLINQFKMNHVLDEFKEFKARLKERVFLASC